MADAVGRERQGDRVAVRPLAELADELDRGARRRRSRGRSRPAAPPRARRSRPAAQIGLPMTTITERAYQRAHQARTPPVPTYRCDRAPNVRLSCSLKGWDQYDRRRHGDHCRDRVRDGHGIDRARDRLPSPEPPPDPGPSSGAARPPSASTRTRPVDGRAGDHLADRPDPPRGGGRPRPALLFADHDRERRARGRPRRRPGADEVPAGLQLRRHARTGNEPDHLRDPERDEELGAVGTGKPDLDVLRRDDRHDAERRHHELRRRHGSHDRDHRHRQFSLVTPLLAMFTGGQTIDLSSTATSIPRELPPTPPRPQPESDSVPLAVTVVESIRFAIGQPEPRRPARASRRARAPRSAARASPRSPASPGHPPVRRRMPPSPSPTPRPI